MATPKQPKDHLPKGGLVSDATRSAVKTQAANVAQKGILDMLYSKVLYINGVLRQERADRALLTAHLPVVPAESSQKALDSIAKVIAMSRYETKDLRTSAMVDFPDEAIQAIVSKAVDDITNVLLEDK